MLYFLQKLLLFSIPLRELAGFEKGIPLRLGEILMGIYVVYVFGNCLFQKKIRFFSKDLLSKKIVLLLGLNIILTSTVFYHTRVDFIFAKKYLVRNILIFLFFISLLIKPIYLKKRDRLNFFKFIVLIQLIMLILQKLGYTIQLFSLVEFPLNRRFQGTASEAGYLPTLIAPALYYFRNSKRNKRYYYLGIFEIFMTFSSYGYVVLVVEGILSFIKRKKIKKKKFIKKLLIIPIVILCFIPNYSFITATIEEKLSKVTMYINKERGDFSTRARNQQLNFIKNQIQKLEKEKLFLGEGTGSYSFKQVMLKGRFMEISEEGHTLYNSTLHDRGIFGWLILIMIFCDLGYMIYKLRKNKVVMSFCYLYILQLIHWKITGNMWLYYFWISSGYIVSQYEIRHKYKKRGFYGFNKYNYSNIQAKRIIYKGIKKFG